MEITLIQFLLGLLLMVVPAYFVAAYRLRFGGKMVSAFVMMLVKYAVVGALLYMLFLWENIAANVLFALACVAFASLAVVMKARLSVRHYYVPVAVGTLAAVAVVGAYVMLVVLQGCKPLTCSRLLPVVGVLCGGIVQVVAKALSFYYMGLRNHSQMYYYLLGNGATRSEALFYFRKRAFERVLTHYVSRMSLAVVGSTPFVMWALLMCGVDVLSAVMLQVLLLVAVFAAVLLAVGVALWVATRYSLDAYGRMKDAVEKPAEAPDVEENEAENE